jgi:hypothetical protein
MSKDDPHTVREDGQSAPPEQADKRDDELRLLAAERLAEYLDIGAGLVARCEHLAAVPKGDRLGPLNAAARLMRANAQVAQALATVAQVERRRRSIVERIEPVDPKIAELNSENKKNEIGAETRLKIYRRMKELVEAAIRERSENPQASTRIDELIAHEEEELAGCRQGGWVG